MYMYNYYTLLVPLMDVLADSASLLTFTISPSSTAASNCWVGERGSWRKGERGGGGGGGGGEGCKKGGKGGEERRGKWEGKGEEQGGRM